MFIIAMTGRFRRGAAGRPTTHLDGVAVQPRVVGSASRTVELRARVVDRLPERTPLRPSPTIRSITEAASPAAGTFDDRAARSGKTGANPRVHLALLRSAAALEPVGLSARTSSSWASSSWCRCTCSSCSGSTPCRPASRCCPSRSPCSSPPRPARHSGPLHGRAIARPGSRHGGGERPARHGQPQLSAAFAVTRAMLAWGWGSLSQLGPRAATVDASAGPSPAASSPGSCSARPCVARSARSCCRPAGLCAPYPPRRSEVSARSARRPEPDRLVSPTVQAAAEDAGLDQATTAALVEDYGKAQLGSLKVGLLTAALLALLALMSHPGDASRITAPQAYRIGRSGRRALEQLSTRPALHTLRI